MRWGPISWGFAALFAAIAVGDQRPLRPRSPKQSRAWQQESRACKVSHYPLLHSSITLLGLLFRLRWCFRVYHHHWNLLGPQWRAHLSVNYGPGYQAGYLWQ